MRDTASACDDIALAVGANSGVKDLSYLADDTEVEGLADDTGIP